jgi:hypothetical protein
MSTLVAGIVTTVVAVLLQVAKGLFGLDKPIEHTVQDTPGEKINDAIQKKLRELDQALR